MRYILSLLAAAVLAGALLGNSERGIAVMTDEQAEQELHDLRPLRSWGVRGHS
jgi:hypothetical protein